MSSDTTPQTNNYKQHVVFLLPSTNLHTATSGASNACSEPTAHLCQVCIVAHMCLNRVTNLHQASTMKQSASLLIQLKLSDFWHAQEWPPSARTRHTNQAIQAAATLHDHVRQQHLTVSVSPRVKTDALCGATHWAYKRISTSKQKGVYELMLLNL